MIKKTPDIEIEKSDIFKNDLLERKDEIENLTPIILNVNEPLVLAIDSPWGTGKTTFVRLWEAYLESQSCQAIYFNAWETDYAEDPLIVMVSEINKWLEQNNDGTELEKWASNLKDVLPTIAKHSALAAAKVATFGAMDVSSEYERVAAELTGSITGDLIENYNKQAESIKKFKEKIIPDALDALPDGQDNLVIFIDELDRCRPTYAIELLERIKHLFSIDRLVFILSTDTAQLSHSVCAVYGHGFDAKKYLQRFIDLDYKLKKPNRKKYIDCQFGSSGVNDRLKTCLNLLAIRFDLELRDINLLSTRIRLILPTIQVNTTNYLEFFVFLLVLRDQNKDLYDQYTKSNQKTEEVIKFFCEGFSVLETEEFEGRRVINRIIACLINRIESNFNNGQLEIDQFASPYQEIIDDYDTQKKQIKRIVNTISDYFVKDQLTLLYVEKTELLHRLEV